VVEGVVIVFVGGAILPRPRWKPEWPIVVVIEEFRIVAHEEASILYYFDPEHDEANQINDKREVANPGDQYE